MTCKRTWGRGIAVVAILALVVGARPYLLARWWGAGTSMRGARLPYAPLGGVRLSYARLACADLRHADLRAALLDNADLTGADLRGADLRGAVFGAFLPGARLQHADLRGADLTHARLLARTTTDADTNETARHPDADLAGAIYDLHTHWPPDYDPAAHGARLVPP